EQLERVPTHRRPSYIAYYPTWLGKLRIMGERLARVRLDDASHVGGDVIELRRIRTALFGSGAHPVIVTPRGQPVDTLDVADVVSERDHEYALRFAVRHENWTEVAPAPDGHPVADGGRLQRTLERFVLAGRPGSPATWVFRTDRRNDCRVELTFNGEPLTPVDVTRGDGWAEHETAIDAHLVRSHNVLTRRCLGDAGVGVYHDWLYQ
ncbi:MAG TPA: hypothetical protein RMH99_29500, partial [Sandaracinaceae bacterium LLY-WYZ-13_1]|nr:hypothetical protein [Sandaracinaceae bacterium LLY-WYZ-13_1]